MGEKKNSCRFSVGDIRKKVATRKASTEVRNGDIRDETVWTGFIWLGMEKSGRIL
jgi:hypothetical protein